MSLDPYLEPVVRPPRVVAHLDMDAFYASVEVRENPALRGLPVIVGADPQGGRGRGIVATASYEARRFGIHSAMPISHAWRLCPHGVFVRPRFRLYSAASERVFAIMRRHAPVVEAASIDEAYLDLTSVADDVDAGAAFARAIQRDVLDEEQLSCSVGVGPNKLVAKIASDAHKPRGLTVVRPEDAASFLAPMPVRKLPGVGPKTDDALRALGILTCADLAALPPERLLEWFGSWGPRLGEAARGVHDGRVVEDWTRKSSGAESTFMVDEREPDALYATIADLAEEAVDGLAAEKLAARTVTLKVRTSDFETYTRARTLEEPTRDAALVADVARDLLAANFPAKPVRLLGVRLTQLTRRATRQGNLDLWPADVAADAGPFARASSVPWRRRTRLTEWT